MLATASRGGCRPQATAPSASPRAAKSGCVSEARCEPFQRPDSVRRRMFMAATMSGAATSLSPSLRSMAGSFVGESLTVDLLNVVGICPPPGLSAETGPSFPGAGTEPWITSDDGHECCLCRCCHNGRVKPDKNQRAIVKSMSEAQLLDLLLAQLSMRAQEAGCFDTLFPVLQAIHRRLSVSSTGESNISLLAQLSMRAQEAGCFDTLFPVLQAIHRRLSVSSTGESNISGASLRNLDKMISKMSCQQMILFAKKNPNVDSGIMQLVMDQLTGSCPTAPFDLSGSSAFCSRAVKAEAHSLKLGAVALGAGVRRHRRAEGRSQLSSGPDLGSRCYIVQSILGKGAGAVATRPLTAGELLAEEEPLLQWSGEDQDQLQQLFDALPLDKQRAMMDLQDSFADQDSEKTLLGVACTNAFTFQNEEEERCLYLEISRFNHSCRPNCEGSWDERLGMLQVYACEDIPSGDELCLFYTDVRKPRQLRQEKLQTLGFTCACPVCRGADPASDRRRERLWQLSEEIPSCEDPEQALDLIRESFELSDEEGLNISCFREVTAYQAYTSCLSMGRKEEAGKWAQRAYEFSLKGHGPYHATTKIISRHASRYRS
eukprot:s7719_g1.t2